MIDTKELRIGNLVFRQGKKLITLKYEVWAIDKVVPKSCTQYDPIPITPEWLERLGFERTVLSHCEVWEIPVTYYPEKLDDVSLMVVFTTGQICVSIDSVEKYHILYVHQLQNLYFALTGEELTIKA